MFFFDKSVIHNRCDRRWLASRMSRRCDGYSNAYGIDTNHSNLSPESPFHLRQVEKKTDTSSFRSTLPYFFSPAHGLFDHMPTQYAGPLLRCSILDRAVFETHPSQQQNSRDMEHSKDFRKERWRRRVHLLAENIRCTILHQS